MSEILVKDTIWKNGNVKLYVDREKKFIKIISNGIVEPQEYKELTEAVKNEMEKYRKGEPVYLNNSSNLDMRFFSTEMMKVVDEFTSFGHSYCKKFATVIPSFVLRKGVGGVVSLNLKIFDNEPEALKWLFMD